MKIDMDDLENRAKEGIGLEYNSLTRVSFRARMDETTVLALVARIRRLETALDAIEVRCDEELERRFDNPKARNHLPEAPTADKLGIGDPIYELLRAPRDLASAALEDAS